MAGEACCLNAQRSPRRAVADPPATIAMIQVNFGHRASGARAGNSRTPANDKHAPRPLLPFPPRHLPSHRRVRDRCHGSVIAATAKASALTSAPLCVVEPSVYSARNLYGRRPMNRSASISECWTAFERLLARLSDRCFPASPTIAAAMAKLAATKRRVSAAPNPCRGSGWFRQHHRPAFRRVRSYRAAVRHSRPSSRSSRNRDRRRHGASRRRLYRAGYRQRRREDRRRITGEPQQCGGRQTGDIFSLHGATLHASGRGDCFDLAARRPATWAVPKAQRAALRPEKGQRQSGPTARPEYCRASDTSP